jgi:hypothetical protein
LGTSTTSTGRTQRRTPLLTAGTMLKSRPGSSSTQGPKLQDRVDKMTSLLRLPHTTDAFSSYRPSSNAHTDFIGSDSLGKPKAGPQTIKLSFPGRRCALYFVVDCLLTDPSTSHLVYLPAAAARALLSYSPAPPRQTHGQVVPGSFRAVSSPDRFSPRSRPTDLSKSQGRAGCERFALGEGVEGEHHGPRERVVEPLGGWMAGLEGESRELSS